MSNMLSNHPEEFRYLILALQRQGSRQLNNLYSQLNLTNSQAEAIEIVGNYGPMSTKEVGNYLICESGSPSRLLSTLAEKGISRTAQSTTDKRTTLHALTPKGREILAQVSELKESFHKELSSELSRASNLHPNNIFASFAYLLNDPYLKAAMHRRFPNVFDHL